MTTFPLTTLAATIDATGISAPSFADIFQSLQVSYRSIYGADAYLEPDSQDGQMLGIFALAIKDSNDLAIAIYNAFSPVTAQGNGLSSLVKINGMARLVSSSSTADLTIVGQPGTIIVNGIVADVLNNRWNMPSFTTIPAGGLIVVTAVAEQLGNIAAAPNTITTIVTPTAGWQTATNLLSAVPGAPVETDAGLRQRQSVSTSLPSQTPLAGIFGAVANVPGVEQLAVYENDGDITDVNGIPPHSISVVALGGDATAIASAIALRRAPGAGTYGNTTEVITDQKGIPVTISFWQPLQVTITVQITISALNGYVSTTGIAIQAAVAAYIGGLGVGQNLFFSKIFGPANLNNGPLANTYILETDGLLISRSPAPLADDDITIVFNEIAVCAPANVTIVIA